MPSKSKAQAKTMTAACKSAEFRKKVDIPKEVACDFHKADKGKYHKEDIDMNEELDRIKKLAGVEADEIVSEKVELNASADNPHKDAKASDVSQAMNMAKLKKTVEDRDDDDVDFKGLFTGVARGEISLDDKGKIAEGSFIKELDEACGKKHKKTVEEETASDEKKAGRRAAGSYGRPGSKEQKRDASKSSRREGEKDIKNRREELDEFNPMRRPEPPKNRFAGKPLSKLQNLADRLSREGGRVPRDLHDTIYNLQQHELDENPTNVADDDYDTYCPNCGQSPCVCDDAPTSDDDLYETSMFDKDSLSRAMVEMIFEEMKKGKTSEEISEELSFSHSDVQPVFDHLKKKVIEGHRIVAPIDRNQHPERPGLEGPYRADSGLIYYYDPTEGKHYDPSTDMYISNDELVAHGIQEDGLPRDYDAWRTTSPYENEPSEEAVDYASEMGEDYGTNYLHTDDMAKAIVADLRDPTLDPGDRAGMMSDLVSDVEGTIINGLENDDNMVLSDDEVKDLALLVVKKHLTTTH